MITRQARITRKKQLLLLKHFALDLTATQAGELSKVNRKCANRWYKHFREVILENSRKAPRFSGEVEIDQSQFGGRGRKRTDHQKKLEANWRYSKRSKEARERRLNKNKVTVIGIMQRNGDVYTQIIAKEDRATIFPIIHLVIEEGSTIYTDKWRSFETLDIDGYKHQAINHSEMFTGKKGVHINTIEAFWSFAKRRLKKFNGMSRRNILLHVKESEFRYNNEDIFPALKKLAFK